MKSFQSKSDTAARSGQITFFGKGSSQAFFGNDNQSSFFNHTPVQAKLTVNKPGDKYEQEADAMADKVVQRLATPEPLTKKDTGVQAKPLAAGITPIIQTKCTDCEQQEKLQKKEEDKDENDLLKTKLQKKPIFESNTKPPDDEDAIQRKCDECEKDDVQKLQTKTENNSTQIASPSVESNLNASTGKGNSLPESTRTQMESSFGADFSNVRIHNDSPAVQMSKNLHAQAFTRGNDIYFNAGKYDTNSQGGNHLLAHELTHVIQQSKKNQNIQKQSETDDDIDLEKNESSSGSDNGIQSFDEAEDIQRSTGDNSQFIQRTCAGNCPQGKQPRKNRNDCDTGQPVNRRRYITALVVTIATQTVEATWSDGSTDSWDCSPNPTDTPRGPDLVGLKCTINHTNRKRDGMAWFTGFQSEGKRIGFHDSQTVGTGVFSHGCVRVCCDHARIINQNTWSGVTTINVI